jgi:methylmalonyl-CoA/ethylmalonyl-CoA epimerase
MSSCPAVDRKGGGTLIGIDKIDHICVAVRDLQEAIKRWGPFLGKDRPDLEYTHAGECIRVARYYVGEVGFELMCSTRKGSDVDNFIKKRGEGVMLISFKIPDTISAMQTLKDNAYEMVDAQPRVWEDSHYAFLKPGSMNGVLVEVIDGPDD